MRCRIFSIAICLSFCCAAQAPAVRPPKIVTFNVPGAPMGIGSATAPNSINGVGAITGYYFTEHGQNGFVRAPDGTITTFAVPGAAGTDPFSINAAGDITGGYDDGGRNQGFVRAASGAITTFGVPAAGAGSGQGTLPQSINARGQVVGWYLDTSNVFHGFLRDTGGVFTTIDAPGAGTSAYQGTEAISINDGGVIIGYFWDAKVVYHSFILMPKAGMTTFIAFDAPGAGASENQGTSALSINDLGFVTGYYQDANAMYHGFLRTPEGAVTSIDIPGASETFPAQVNSRGDVAGYGVPESPQAFCGFFRTTSGTTTTFDVQGAGTGVSEGTVSVGINNSGQIAGFYIDSNFEYHGFLLIP